MADLTLTHPEGKSPYAGIGRRAIALLIDGLILLVPCALIYGIGNPESVWDWDAAQGEETGLPVHFELLAVGSLLWIYKAALEGSWRQATVGKQLVRIMVVNMAGQPISFSRASLRCWPFYAASFAALIDAVLGMELVSGLAALAIFVSCIAVAFTRRKQGLHDMLAKCLVVMDRTAFDGNQRQPYEAATNNVRVTEGSDG